MAHEALSRRVCTHLARISAELGVSLRNSRSMYHVIIIFHQFQFFSVHVDIDHMKPTKQIDRANVCGKHSFESPKLCFRVASLRPSYVAKVRQVKNSNGALRMDLRELMSAVSLHPLQSDLNFVRHGIASFTTGSTSVLRGSSGRQARALEIWPPHASRGHNCR